MKYRFGQGIMMPTYAGNAAQAHIQVRPPDGPIVMDVSLRYCLAAYCCRLTFAGSMRILHFELGTALKVDSCNHLTARSLVV